MKLLHISAIILAASIAGQGAEARVLPYIGTRKVDNPEYHEVYMSNGHEIPEGEAFMAAVKDAKVYRCIQQEVSMGKTGRSAGLKNMPRKIQP